MTGEQRDVFPPFDERRHHDRHHGEAIAVEPGDTGHDEARHPERPPVEEHGMGDDPDLAGAALGLLVAAGAAQVFHALAKELPRLEEIRLNGSIVAYSLACAVAEAATSMSASTC